MPDTDLNTQRIVPMELQENVQAMDIDNRLLGVSNGGEGSSKGIVNGTQEGQTQFDAHFPPLTGKKGTGKEKVQGTQLPDKQKQKHTAWKGENKKVFMNTGVGARLRYIKDQPVVLKNSDALPIDQVYTNAPGSSCPGVPILPAVCIFFNMFLFAQLHIEAWVRFVIVNIITVGVYALYGQYHANPGSEETLIYHRVPQFA